MEIVSVHPSEPAGQERNILCQDRADRWRKGSGENKSSLYNARVVSIWALGARAVPSSVQPPEGASERWFLEGDGRAVGSLGGGYFTGPLATPTGVLITPPGQGQLQV